MGVGVGIGGGVGGGGGGGGVVGGGGVGVGGGGGALLLLLLYLILSSTTAGAATALYAPLVAMAKGLVRGSDRFLAFTVADFDFRLMARNWHASIIRLGHASTCAFPTATPYLVPAHAVPPHFPHPTPSYSTSPHPTAAPSSSACYAHSYLQGPVSISKEGSFGLVSWSDRISLHFNYAFRLSPSNLVYI